MNKSAVVFGPTGLVGTALCNELLRSATHEKVIAVTRRKMPVDNPKLEHVLISDYSQLDMLKESLQASEWYCCIGTTIKIAGSQEAFRRVDFEIPHKIAQAADEMSVQSLVIISSIGADAASSNFYLKTKGEMEDAVRAAYKGNLKIVRPSLLMGDRKEFRFGEKVAVGFMKIFGWAFAGPMKRYRGIKASDVAKAMIVLTELQSEKTIFQSDELYDLARK